MVRPSALPQTSSRFVRRLRFVRCTTMCALGLCLSWWFALADENVSNSPKSPAADKAATDDTWWSLRPLKRPEVPHVDQRWPQIEPINAIDRFVLSRLVENGLEPSPLADRRTLIRRVHFDLLGLPPTSEEVEEFVADSRDDADRKSVV